MGEKTEAETALAVLEQHTHDYENTKHALANALLTGDPDRVEAATVAHAAALKIRDASGMTKGDRFRAAQAVLDERGEAHTETNIHPPGVVIVHEGDAKLFQTVYDAVSNAKDARERKQAKLDFLAVTGHEWHDEGED